MKIPVLFFAASIAVFSGCEKSATISLNYATTGIGVHNAAKYDVGKVFVWQPANNLVRDLADVDARASGYSETPVLATTDTAREVRGFVTSNNFQATPAQRASLELKASNATNIKYSNYRIMTSDDTRGAMAAYINARPEAVAADWALDDAIASGDTYYVTVFKTIETETASLEVGRELSGSASVDVPSVEGDVKISLSDTSEIQCNGRQRCFFDVRIYQPYKNSAGNYDFRRPLNKGIDRRAFVEDLRDSIR